MDRTDSGGRPFDRRALASLLLVAGLLTPAVAVWAAVWGGYRLPVPDVAQAVLALMLAPLLEEWVLREGLQRGLASWGRRGAGPSAGSDGLAVLISTLAFALIHLDDFSAAALLRCMAWLLPGLVLALVWCWRHRLGDCVLMHVYFNASLALASLI